MDIDLDDIFSVPATKPAPAASKFRPNANRPVLRKGKCAPGNAKQGTSKSLEPAPAVNKAQSVAETDAHVQEEVVSQSLNPSENVMMESILESQRPPVLSSMRLDEQKDLEIPVQKSVTFEEDALLIGRCSHIDKETVDTEVEAEVFPGLATIESFPDSIGTTCTGQHRGKFIPKKMKGGLKKSSSGIQHSEAEKDHLPDILVDFEADLANKGPTPSSVSEDVISNSALMLDESTPGGQPDSETLKDCSEPSQFDASISRESEVGDDPDVLGNSNAKRDTGVQDSLQKPGKSSNGSAANEVAKSSRPLKKRGVTTLHRGGESDVETQNSDCIAREANVNANGEETLSQVKKGPRKSKKTSRTKGETKPTKKRKNGDDGTVPEEKPSEEQEPPKKKKFTHSTQRRKRVVDKVLLQTPEEDIDYQKLSMRDLILLAEHKEKLAGKKVKMPKTSQGSAASRQEESVDGDDSRNNESTVTPEEDEALDEGATDNVEPIITLFNYQSFMNKTPKIKWSKQDTELFYEGIRQFGTDLGMIKQLFPDLTRHQVKLKYKKEERQNPLRLSEAIHGGAKDHRHFELVIKRLEAANKAEAESIDDDDDDDDGEQEEEEEESNKNQEEAASIPNLDTKDEKKETKDEEIDHVNFETPQHQQDEEEEDDEIDEDFFSSYKTEL